MKDILKNGAAAILLRRQTNILSAAAVMMAIYAISSVTGLIRTRLLAAYFLNSQARWLDVYNAASWVPETIFQLLVVGALSAAFVPTFSKFLLTDKEDAWRMANGAISLAVLAVGGVSLIALLGANVLSAWLAPGFAPDQLAVMANLLRLMLIAQVFFAISGFLMGIIQSQQRFLVPALAPVVYNLGIITGTVLLSGWIGIYGPAVGVVVGAFGHMVIQWPVARSLGLRWRWVWQGWRIKGVWEVLRLMPARVIALGVDQIEQSFAILLSSLLVPGSLSLLNIARNLYALPVTLFGVTIGQAALPALTTVAVENKKEEYIRALSGAILQICFLALPVAILFIVLRIPTIRLVFGSRTFPWTATLLTGKVLAVLSVSAAFYAVMQLVIRGFYALHDTGTPLAVGVLAASFNLFLSLFLVNSLGWGIVGLAVAISATAILETIILVVLLFQRLGFVGELWPRLGQHLAKMVVVGLATGVGLWVPMHFLDAFVFDTTRTLPLLGLTVIASAVGLSIYLALSYLLRVEQLAIIADLSKRLSRWRQLLSSTPAPEPVISE